MFCFLINSNYTISLTTATPVITLEPEPKSTLRPSFLPSILDNKENKELSTALRRRRDRFARQQEMLNNSNSGIYNGIFVNTNGHSNTNGITNGGYTNGTYSKPYTNGTVNGTSYTNGINGHDEEQPFVNRTAKSLNLADVLKNGLFFSLTH